MTITVMLSVTAISDNAKKVSAAKRGCLNQEDPYPDDMVTNFKVIFEHIATTSRDSYVSIFSLRFTLNKCVSTTVLSKPP